MYIPAQLQLLFRQDLHECPSKSIVFFVFVADAYEVARFHSWLGTERGWLIYFESGRTEEYKCRKTEELPGGLNLVVLRLFFPLRINYIFMASNEIYLD